MRTATVRAYLAATLDCEGSISVLKKNQGPGREDQDAWSLTVQVTNTNPDLILWLDNHFDGGSVSWRDRGAPRRTVYAWEIRGKACKSVLKAALPYMVVKNTQAELALRFIETLSVKGTRVHRVSEEVRRVRNEIATAMSVLNQRGVCA